MPPSPASSLVILLVLLASSARALETHDERVTLTPLLDGSLALDFAFESSSTRDDARHRAKTSKTLASTLTTSDAASLEVWFGRGRWNARRWGAPPSTARAIGAEVIGRWRARALAGEGWRRATRTLGGTFCASLRAMDAGAVTTEPALGFRPWDGDERGRVGTVDEDVVKRASLPGEAVCVENLAPWLKQLPCRDRAGLAKALKTAHVVFGARHVTLGARMWMDGDTVRTEQTLMMVLRSDGDAFRGVMDLIKEAGANTCVAADSSRVQIYDGEEVRTFDLSAANARALDAWAMRPVHRAPKLFIERFLTGTGNENGGIVIDVERNLEEKNAHASSPIRIRLFQPLPWFVRLYMHTLSVELDGEVVRGATEGIRYVPAKDRVRSSLLELQMVIPSNASTLRLSLDFDKGFLRSREFPPDANRGFDLPSARLDYFALEGDARPSSVYLNGLLLLLPTPDFSMVYNAVALAGSALSILVLTTIRSLTVREAWRDYKV